MTVFRDVVVVIGFQLNSHVVDRKMMLQVPGYGRESLLAFMK